MATDPLHKRLARSLIYREEDEMDNSDDDCNVVPNSANGSPSLKKMKLKKKKKAVATPEGGTKPIVLALTSQISPAPHTKPPQNVQTKRKRTTDSKSAPVRKRSVLDIGADGYGVLLHQTDADAVENGTSNNVSEERGNILTTAAHASPVEVPHLHANDHHVVNVMPMPVVESQDFENYIHSTEAAPLNGTAVDGVADNCLSQLPYPIAPTADDSNAITNGLPHTEQAAVGNATNSPRREMDGLDNFTISEFFSMFDTDSSPDEVVEYPTALYNVNGYRVREDLAPTAQFILSKYGDIVGDTSHTLSFRSAMLETVSGAYQKLEKCSLANLPLPELEAIRKDVGAVAQLNFGVSWLVKRLDEIHDAKKSLQQLSCYKDERIVRAGVISELEKELELQKDILQKAQHKVENIEEKLKSEKGNFEARDMAIMEAMRKYRKRYKSISLADDM